MITDSFVEVIKELGYGLRKNRLFVFLKDFLILVLGINIILLIAYSGISFLMWRPMSLWLESEIPYATARMSVVVSIVVALLGNRRSWQAEMRGK